MSPLIDTYLGFIEQTFTKDEFIIKIGLLEKLFAVARILLVEDQHNIRLLIATLLKSRGHEIIEAEDGEEAHDILQNPPSFDMLITDLQMPRLDGTELIQYARSDHPKLLILAVSAYHDRLADAQAKGADEILTKPFSHRQLMDIVSSLVDRLPN